MRRRRATTPSLLPFEITKRVEAQNPDIEKLALALVSATRWLRSYFHAYTITIPTAYTLLQLLHKPDVSRRLTKWAMELCEFHITLVPVRAIKAQPVEDFSPN